MEYSIHFSTIDFYMHRNWFFYFNKSKHVISYNIRLFGMCILFKEKYVTDKLIELFKASKR